MNEPLTEQEAPANYQVMLSTPRVKEGYKQTEVGMIPGDWEVRDLGSIGRVIRGASPRPKGDKRFYGGDVPRLMVEDVTRDGKYVFPQVDFLTIEGARRSRPCPKGTLTVVCSGTVGIPSFLGLDACIHDGFLALIKLERSVSDDYLFHQLTSLQQRFNLSATHGGVFTNLTTSSFGAFQVAFPPNIQEQRAIATALSDIDALLTTQDKLIAKKRDIKQAAMQQLLTGKQRLPGFTGDWEVKRLENIATVLKGNGLSKDKVSQSGSKKCVLYGELFTTYSRVITDVLSSTDSCEGTLSINGDVLLPGSTTTTGIDLATASALLCNDVLLGGDINIVRAKSNFYSSTFLAYLLTEEKKHKIAEMAQGITIIHLYGKNLLKLEICLPTIEEQIAIAAVLSDMDADLNALEQQRNKTYALKQGMMQELLTGRIRLV